MQKRKTVRPWMPEQTTVLPPSPGEWFSEDHQVYSLLDLVDELDPSEILIPLHRHWSPAPRPATTTETRPDPQRC